MKPPGMHARLPVLPFLLLTCGWTWTMWGIAVLAGLSAAGSPGSLLYLLGVLGPLAGATWVVYRGGRAYRHAFLRRIVDPRRIPGFWWLALIAMAAVPAVLGAASATVRGARVDVVDYGAGGVGVVVVIALVAGLAEEPGWRGAALDACQVRHAR